MADDLRHGWRRTPVRLRIRRFERTGELEPALGMLRRALTGVHLMRTGQMLADLGQLSEGHDLPYVPELVAAKVAGNARLDEGIVSRGRLVADVHRLHLESGRARRRSPLPKRASNVEALNDLIVRVHLEGG